MSKYLHDWSIKNVEKDFNKKWGEEALIRDFDIKPEELEGMEILLATYGQMQYEGNAFVLFKKGNKYYEVNASHCSCFGLEGQWKPEEANLKELYHRATKGSLGKDDYCEIYNFNKELLDILKQEEEGGATW